MVFNSNLSNCSCLNRASSLDFASNSITCDTSRTMLIPATNTPSSFLIGNVETSKCNGDPVSLAMVLIVRLGLISSTRLKHINSSNLSNHFL